LTKKPFISGTLENCSGLFGFAAGCSGCLVFVVTRLTGNYLIRSVQG
jgi:hypothetical protein